MGPTWVLLAPDGPHDGPINLAIRVESKRFSKWNKCTHKVIKILATGTMQGSGRGPLWYRHWRCCIVIILRNCGHNCVPKTCKYFSYIETKRSSYWQPSHHRLHPRLSERQPRVHPVTRSLSIWRLFGFGVIFYIDIELIPHQLATTQIQPSLVLKEFVLFDYNFKESFSSEYNYKQAHISVGDGLVLYNWQVLTWTNDKPIVLFHNIFFSSGEQPEQRIAAHKL